MVDNVDGQDTLGDIARDLPELGGRLGSMKDETLARLYSPEYDTLSGPIRKFFDAPYRSCKTEEDKDFAGNLIAHTRESINEIELRTTKTEPREPVE